MLLSTPLFSAALLSNNYIQNEDFLINIFKLLTWHYFSLLLSTSMLWYCRRFEQSETVYNETSSSPLLDVV